MQRLAYQLFRYIGAVAVGRVDEIDADLGKPPKRSERSLAVGRRAPDAGAREPHGAISETIDGDVPNPELTGEAGVARAHRKCPLFPRQPFAPRRSEHRSSAALGLLGLRLILNDIPVLGEPATVDAENLGDHRSVPRMQFIQPETCRQTSADRSLIPPASLRPA